MLLRNNSLLPSAPLLLTTAKLFLSPCEALPVGPLLAAAWKFLGVVWGFLEGVGETLTMSGCLKATRAAWTVRVTAERWK